jgi:hypothetical protein
MMRFLLLIGAPAILGIYCFLLSPSLPRAILVLLAIMLSTIAAILKKAAYITAAASACVVNYFTALPAAEERLRIWGSLFFGLGLYLYIEIGNDILRVLPQEISAGTYRLRFRYLFLVAAIAIACSLIVLTLAYNFAIYLPGVVTLPLILAGLLAIVLGAGALTIYQIQRPD